MASSSKESDNAKESTRGSYKRYLHHGSDTRMPRSTKFDHKIKRAALSKNRPESASRILAQSSREDNPHVPVPVTPDRVDIDEDTEKSPNIDSGKTFHEDSSTLPLETNNTHSEPRYGESVSARSSPVQIGDDNEDLPREKYTDEFLIQTLLILATKLCHNLTYEASNDIVELLSVLHKTPKAQASKYYWKKVINDFSKCMAVHHICDECRLYIGVQSEDVLKCKHCDKLIDEKSTLDSGKAFLYISLTYQLREIFELTKAHYACLNKFRKQKDCAIEDIFDGKLYKQHLEEDMISINFCVDGVPVFDSSQMSIYPILCTINELEPHDRKNHVLLCGLWFGNGKPSINQYLQPFVTEAQQLYRDGFEYEYEGIRYTKRCRVLAGICDSVARPMLRNSKQFNGEYGCGLCLNSGEVVNKGRGSTRVYPLGPGENPWGEGLRKLEDTLQHIERKEKGMKGRSVLCDIPRFDIISSLPVDWMHCVALGVCRQVAKLWFDQTYHNEDFYFGHLIGAVDEHLLSYKPTSEVSRTPRAMSDRLHWKAHEWVVFLLFYSVPTLNALFPKKYVAHWALLVDGIQMLCQSTIMKSEVVVAHRLFIQFVKGIDELYGREHISFNVHLLTHLAESVEQFGPLWTHSAFIYEDTNQMLLKYVKSSNGVAVQICDTFRTKCVVDRLRFICNNKITLTQNEYLDKVLKKGVRPKPTFIHADVGMLGTAILSETLPRTHSLAFERGNVNLDQASTIESYKRVIIHGEVIHSQAYSRTMKRCNYYVRLIDDEIFEIAIFYVVKSDENISCYALGRYFEKSSKPLINGRILKHLVRLNKCLRDLAIIKVTQIRGKVLMLNVQQQSFACIHPNNYELLT